MVCGPRPAIILEDASKPQPHSNFHVAGENDKHQNSGMCRTSELVIHVGSYERTNERTNKTDGKLQNIKRAVSRAGTIATTWEHIH